MSKKALQQRLNELHTELAAATELDPGLRHSLREVANDIEKLLDEAEPDTDTGDLQNRVQQATVEFEAEHPRLAGILGDLADTLTKLGI
jgi:hypothetical protein